MARRSPRLITLTLTTSQNGAVAFSQAPLYALGGVLRVSTNTLDVGAVPNPDSAFTDYVAGTDLAVGPTPLHQLLVKPTVAAAHGTLTFFGAVVDNEADFIAAVYGGA